MRNRRTANFLAANLGNQFRFRFTMLAALFFLGSYVQAQQPIELKLKDALSYALEANQNARKARLDVEGSEHKIDEVRSRALSARIPAG